MYTDTAPWDRSWEDLLPSKGYLITICRLLLQTPYILVWFFALSALKIFGENKSGLIVFAIVLLTLLPHTVLEVQGRYHHYIMPFIILLASFGYSHFLDRGIKTSEV